MIYRLPPISFDPRTTNLEYESSAHQVFVAPSALSFDAERAASESRRTNRAPSRALG